MTIEPEKPIRLWPPPHGKKEVSIPDTPKRLKEGPLTHKKWLRWAVEWAQKKGPLKDNQKRAFYGDLLLFCPESSLSPFTLQSEPLNHIQAGFSRRISAVIHRQEYQSTITWAWDRQKGDYVLARNLPLEQAAFQRLEELIGQYRRFLMICHASAAGPRGRKKKAPPAPFWERATAVERGQYEEALKDRPELLRRLREGKFTPSIEQEDPRCNKWFVADRTTKRYCSKTCTNRMDMKKKRAAKISRKTHSKMKQNGNPRRRPRRKEKTSS